MDKKLFRTTVGEITPVKNDRIDLNKEPKPKPYPKKAELDYDTALSTTPDESFENLSLEDRLAFIAPGLQKNVLKKLRKGFFGVDAELDLHGLRAQEARQQLLKFLHDCVQEGLRCIHIIHGKGYRSLDQQPILKNKINIWLRQHQSVLAFCSASPKDGGTGAVYVLLHVAEKSQR